MYESLARFFGLFYISAGFILSTDCSSIRQTRRLLKPCLPDSDYDSDQPCSERIPRVHNGYEARSGEFPFMAEVGRRIDDEENAEISWVCGGTLITWSCVLTAAHCIRAYDYVVRVGSVDIRNPQSDTQEIRALYKEIHPDFTKDSRNDIGLLILEKEVFGSANVEPLNLRTSYDLQNINVDAETSYVAIGFGQTSYLDNKSEKLLKTGNMTLIPGKTCWENYFKDPPAYDVPGPDPYDTVICAIDSNRTRLSDPCKGDSGGPLVMLNERNTFLVGITSKGRLCGFSIPGIYTYVLPYLDWIKSHALIEFDHKTDEATSVARFRNWFENLISRESFRIDPR